MLCSGETAVQQAIIKSCQFKQMLQWICASYLANTFDPSVLVPFTAFSDGGVKM